MMTSYKNSNENLEISHENEANTEENKSELWKKRLNHDNIKSPGFSCT